MITDLVAYVRGFLKEMQKDHVGAYAAQASYFIMLSFIPFVLLLLPLVQYTALTKENLYLAAQTVIPDALDSFVIGIIDEVYARGTIAISLSALMTVWSAGKAFFALIGGMNAIYDVEEQRNYIILRLQAAFYTILFVLAIILSLVVLVFGNSIQAMLVRHVPFLSVFTGIFVGLKSPISLVIFTLFFAVLYRFVPSRKSTIRSQIPGALFAAVSWLIFSMGFSIYIDLSSSFSNMYGSLTTLILIMLWLYFSMYLMMIGAEINSYLEKQVYPFQKKEAK